MLPVILGMGALGALQGDQKQKQIRKLNEAAAVQTLYSPWTNMGPGQLQANNESALMGAAQGAVGGVGLAGNLKQAGMFDPSKEQFAGATDNGDGTYGGGSGWMRLSRGNR